MSFKTEDWVFKQAQGKGIVSFLKRPKQVIRELCHSIDRLIEKYSELDKRICALEKERGEKYEKTSK